ncbi:MAG: methyltransferase domain-containing protein [bacterium]
MIRSPYSMLRTLQYERIQGMPLEGPVLDVGGGKRNSYVHLFDVNGVVESINIDPDMEPTYCADLNHPLPVQDDTYNTIISLNTLEHIHKDEALLREMYRVLKPGGRILIMVPFLYRVHASPSDYHRHTAYWWDQLLEGIGFQKQDIIVEPLMWDVIGTGFATSEYWCPPRVPFSKSFRYVRRCLLLLIGTVYQTIRWRGHERLPDIIGLQDRDYALGYFIEARKR